ncbi:DUF4290 domain-containing protein [Snuella sedimenti]|uniref:DUF4290 domain-containing protein n=1 Tax=Snuella sedimenti TaxID=2798802 RepID=UPI001E44166A|nr:DUF4290 domain-containing protein [Snuella sedimenti]
MTDAIYNLEYNTERELLIIPEYGRHLQKMINYAKSRETKEERNKLAKAIISVMGNMQPHLRDVPDFQHKLWDQLFIMSNFELDADSPFEKPTKELLEERPQPLRYPQNFPKYRFYGNNIKTMIDVANTWDKGDLKDALVYTIANHMKKCFLNWNKDTVEDAVIYDHLYELSSGKIDLRSSEEDLSDASSLMRSKSKSKKSAHHHKKSSGGRSRKRY